VFSFQPLHSKTRCWRHCYQPTNRKPFEFFPKKLPIRNPCIQGVLPQKREIFMRGSPKNWRIGRAWVEWVMSQIRINKSILSQIFGDVPNVRELVTCAFNEPLLLQYCKQLLQFARVTVAIISFLPKGEGLPNVRVPVTHASNEHYYCDYWQLQLPFMRITAATMVWLRLVGSIKL